MAQTPPEKEATTSSSRRTWGSITTALLIFITAGVIYFLIYQESRSQYFDQRFIRAAAHLSRQLQAKYHVLQNVVGAIAEAHTRARKGDKRRKAERKALAAANFEIQSVSAIETLPPERLLEDLQALKTTLSKKGEETDQVDTALILAQKAQEVRVLSTTTSHGTHELAHPLPPLHLPERTQLTSAAKEYLSRIEKEAKGAEQPDRIWLKGAQVSAANAALSAGTKRLQQDSDLETQNAIEKTTEETARAVREVTEGGQIERLRLPVKINVLPSIDRKCGTQADYMACVTETTFEQAPASGLESTPDAPPGPVTLSEDRRSLIFCPESREGDSKPQCGKTAILSLLPSAFAADATPHVTMHANNFDEVFLLYKDGTVLLHRGHPNSSLLLSRFPGFEKEEVTASTVQKNVTLGAMNYRAYIQPVPITVATPEESDRRHGSDLLVVGLVAEDHFFHMTTALPATTFLWIVVLVSVCLLLMPLAKLWLLNPSERFGRFDVALLALSTLVASFFICTLFWVSLGSLRLTSHTHEALRYVSDRLELDLQNRLHAVHHALDVFINKTDALRKTRTPDTFRGQCGHLSKMTAKNGISDVTELTDRRAHHSPRLVCETTRVERSSLFEPSKDRPDDPGWLAFWADAHGDQLIKMVPGDFATTPINVEHRSYFKGAMARRPIGPPSSKDAWSARNYAEVIRSGTTGNLVLIVTRALKDKGVAAVQVEMKALQAPVIPLGFQLAVIDRQGRIMLHSELDEHHGQKIFDDFDGDRRLDAALRVGREDKFLTRYQGNKVHVRIKPLENGPGWFVITIADAGLNGIIATDTALSMMVGFAGWFLALLALAGSFAFLDKRHLQLTPISRHAPRYAWWGLITFCLSTFFVILSLMSSKLPWLVGLAVTVAVLMALRRRFQKKDIQGPRFFANIRLARACLWFGVGTVGILAIAPASLLFGAAYQEAATHLVDAHAHHFQTALKNRPECLEKDASCLGVYSLSKPIERAPRQKTIIDGVMNWVMARLPYYSDRQIFLEVPDEFDIHFAAPSSTDLSKYPPDAFLLVVGFLIFLVATMMFGERSLARLYFLPLRDSWWALKPVDIEAVTQAFRTHERLLILYPRSGLTEAIRNAHPKAVLIENLESQLEDDASIETLQGTTSPVVVLSQRDPMAHASEPRKRRWASMLASFHIMIDKMSPLSHATDKPPRIPPTEWARSPYYEQLWAQCSEPEQRILTQLANDGYVNPHPANTAALCQLMSRGVVDPETFTLFNADFGAFVSVTVPPHLRRAWTRADGPSRWAALRLPLCTAVATGLALLGFSQPELASVAATGALAPTMAAGLPSILRLVSSLSPSSSKTT